MESNKYSSIKSLISSIIFFIIGALLFNSPEEIIITVAQIIGGVIAVIGLFKVVLFYRRKKKELNVSRNDLVFGITAIVIGLLLIFLSGAFAMAIRFIMGAWILISGVNKLIAALSIGPSAKNYTSMLIISIILIIVGIYIILVSNLVLSAIGIVIMIYSALEIIGYIVYKLSGTSTESNTKESKEPELIIPEKSNKSKDDFKDAKEIKAPKK